eukprot:CAMPEP_0168748110 /NCGR_PEP_ID=MMETSP0724-20121128/16006_1 /TAXON_ID=265536 /ORGANISM="Amphiprora sp., Strain CCMP467" /LENGTH=181 /DNA_ID=CAMNT_0008795927 /DNA_START=4 /DNA_END=549 /DNA_ORIENTATION=-
MKQIIATLFVLAFSLPGLEGFSSNPGKFSLASLREGFAYKFDEALEGALARLEGDKLQALAKLEAQKEQEVEQLQNELTGALQTVQQRKLNQLEALQQLAELKLEVQEKELEMLRVKLAAMQEQLVVQLHIESSKATELEQLRVQEAQRSIKALEQELAIKILEQKKQLYEKQKLLNDNKQ